MKVIEYVFDATMTDEQDGISAIAFVDQPAIEVGCVYFTSEKKLVNFLNDEKMEIIAPVMIPNLKIYRNDPINGEHMCVYSEETVYNIRNKMMKDGSFNKLNLMHISNDKINDVYLEECWIVEGKNDKIYDYYSEKDIPKGSLIHKYKIDNPEIWSKIKSGELTGLSIEGYMSIVNEKFSKQPVKSDEETIKDILNNSEMSDIQKYIEIKKYLEV